MNFFRNVMLAVLLAAAAPLAGGLALIATASDAEAAVVSNISVRGNQRVDAVTIKTYITIKPGQNYGITDVDESVKILYGTGLFSDVAINRSGSTLIVSVAENPIINSVIFQGNKKIKSNILVQIVDSEARGVLTDSKLQSDLNRIEMYYARNGRPGVQVDASVTELGNNRVDVVFFIIEGERSGVTRIEFIGNKAFSKQRLRSVIQTRQTNWLSWLNRRDIFSEEKLAADQELLRRHYLRYGYADFQILAADVNFDSESGKYQIVFTVEEGPKYKFGQINVDSSIPGVDPAALTGVIETRSGKTFDASKVERSVEALTIELSRIGFVFSQVRPRGDRNYIDNIIDITYVVDEGPRAYVERIEIVGNTKTRDYVIRREFDLSEGDAYNRVLVDKAERRLRNLDFFETVNITTQPGSAPDKVIIVVTVQDKSTGSISAAAGVSTSQGLIAEVALEERNFLGRGQNLRISVGGGLEDRSFNVSFSDPYFLGNRILAGVDAYRNTSQATTARPYATEKTGGGLRVGLPLTDDADVVFNYKASSDVFTTSASHAVPAAFMADTSRFVSSLGYVYTYSTLDNRQDPREGFRFQLKQDFAGVGGDARYVKTEADARYYQPILPDSDIIGMVRLGGGNITGLGQSVSVFDNFYKGGETVRGFAPLGYGPRDSGTGVASGGKNYWVSTAEVQFPLPAVPPDFGLRGALFADAGMLFGTDFAVDQSDTAIRASVGGSILWASPFGLLRADIAHALAKQSYDDVQIFRIGAGANF